MHLTPTIFLSCLTSSSEVVGYPSSFSHLQSLFPAEAVALVVSLVNRYAKTDFLFF